MYFDALAHFADNDAVGFCISFSFLFISIFCLLKTHLHEVGNLLMHEYDVNTACRVFVSDSGRISCGCITRSEAVSKQTAANQQGPRRVQLQLPVLLLL